MLTIRLLLFALILFVGMNAQSQQPVPPASPENEAQPQRAAGVRDTIQSNRGTKKSPIVVELLPAKDAESKVNEEREHQREKSFYDGLIAWGTVALAGFTLFLFIFTALLWATTVQLGREARRTSDRQAQEVQKSLAISQQAADAATKSAEAAVNASKPFLFPRAFNLGSLHPVEKVRDDMKYDPAVNFVFENYGETPAMVREVRAVSYSANWEARFRPFRLWKHSQLDAVNHSQLFQATGTTTKRSKWREASSNAIIERLLVKRYES